MNRGREARMIPLRHAVPLFQPYATDDDSRPLEIESRKNFISILI